VLGKLRATTMGKRDGTEERRLSFRREDGRPIIAASRIGAWRAGGMIRDRWRFEKSQARIASRDRERMLGSPVVHLHR